MTVDKEKFTTFERRTLETIARYEQAMPRLSLKRRIAIFEQMRIAHDAANRASRRRLTKHVDADIDSALAALDAADKLIEKGA